MLFTFETKRLAMKGNPLMGIKKGRGRGSAYSLEFEEQVDR